MKLTFCGANREVTGSCYYLETEQGNIILDCGMFQGGKYAEEKNYHSFPFNPQSVDAVIITHAHFDHVGRLPKLYKEGFRGKIWATEPTRELSMINLIDGSHLLQREAEHLEIEPLYSVQDVEGVSGLWRTLGYEIVQEILPGISIIFSNAGHILGSCSVSIRAENKTIVFSGDLGNPPVPLLAPTTRIGSADSVIIESTYGTTSHESHAHRYLALKSALLDTIQKKGTLIIPAFALERTQELLFELDHLRESSQVPHIPIFLDSPMAIAATEIFKKEVDFFNTDAKLQIKNGNDLFNFEGLVFTRTSTESKKIQKVASPKVIIAGSGMMNGGRVLHHLKNELHKKSTTLLIIGYQAENSLGSHLKNGEKKVKIYGNQIEVAAEVRTCEAFSGHADYPRLMHWLRGFQSHQPDSIWVTHGEEQTSLTFSKSITDELAIPTGVPHFSDSIFL